MRMRKKPNLIPRMERCAEYLITDPEAWPLAGKAVSKLRAAAGTGLRQGPLHLRDGGG